MPPKIVRPNSSPYWSSNADWSTWSSSSDWSNSTNAGSYIVPPAKRFCGNEQVATKAANLHANQVFSSPQGTTKTASLNANQVHKAVEALRKQGGKLSIKVLGGALAVKKDQIFHPSYPWFSECGVEGNETVQIAVLKPPGEIAAYFAANPLVPALTQTNVSTKVAFVNEEPIMNEKASLTNAQVHEVVKALRICEFGIEGNERVQIAALKQAAEVDAYLAAHPVNAAPVQGNTPNSSLYTGVPEVIAGGISARLQKHPKCILSELKQARVISDATWTNESYGQQIQISVSVHAIRGGQEFWGSGTCAKSAGAKKAEKQAELLAIDNLLENLQAAGVPVESCKTTGLSSLTSSTGPAKSFGFGRNSDDVIPSSGDPLFLEFSVDDRVMVDNLMTELKNSFYVESLMEKPSLAPQGNAIKGDAELFQNSAFDGNSAFSGQPRQRIGDLPVAKHEQKIVQAIAQNQITLISGATGSGKSTQIPQYLLEHFANSSGELVRIAVSQPRRISAISTAHRVAWERGEELGISVGYKVRMNSVVPRTSSHIIYLTAGLLLKQIVSSRHTPYYTHVILDEIHERALDSDFLLVIFKKLLMQNPSVKLILMSATLETERFRQYFSNCPIINVEGKMHPVQEYFLEDVVRMCRVEPGAPEEEGSIEEAARLIVALITQISHAPLVESSDGRDAVLIFLPGWQEIQIVWESLSPLSSTLPRGLTIVPLHSTLDHTEQRRVFERASPGMLKIILSTNLAETSVTIDDILYVIDSGKVKQTSYLPNRKLTVFGPAWIAKSSAEQRKGRAGRVQKGVCFRLYSRETKNSFQTYPVPEIQRVAMHQTILQIKLLDLDPDPKSFLSETLDPPPPTTIDEALQDLVRMDCLSESLVEENTLLLTMLGSRVAKLPGVDPQLGRTLFLGCIFEVLDPVLTAVASFQLVRPPFRTTAWGRSCRIEAIQAKQHFSSEAPGSDDLAVILAFEEWRSTYADTWSFCEQNYLDDAGMRTLKDLRSLIVGGLLQDLAPGASDNALESLSVASHDREVVRAAVVAGLYPNFAINSVKGKRAYWTKSEGVCIVHPESVNSKPNAALGLPICFFHEKVRIEHESGVGGAGWGDSSGGGGKPKTYLKDTTLTSGLPVLLFSYDDLQFEAVRPDSSVVKIWIPALGDHIVFFAEEEDAIRIYAVRRAVVAFLRRFSQTPVDQFSQVETAIVNVCRTLLKSDRIQDPQTW